MKNKNWLYWVASFVLPPLGCVFYGMFKEKEPEQSKMSGYGTLYGILFYFVFFLVFLLFIK